MRVVIQRVKSASISIEDNEAQHMGQGLVVLFGVSEQDKEDVNPTLIEKLAAKTANLRIFSDNNSKMNLSAGDLNLSIMVVSQFTLFADTKKGNRPSFIAAAEPSFAESIYERFLTELKKYNWKEFLTGSFRKHMVVGIENDGPVTIIIDTKEWE